VVSNIHDVYPNCGFWQFKQIRLNSALIVQHQDFRGRSITTRSVNDNPPRSVPRNFGGHWHIDIDERLCSEATNKGLNKLIYARLSVK